MNYYPHHIGDYAKDTMHLSIVEHGVYRLLLDRYYSKESPIPAKDAHRFALARTKSEKAAVDRVLAEFFTLEDGAWHNRRADAEIESARRKAEAAAENGRRGGRPKQEPAANPEETQQEATRSCWRCVRQGLRRMKCLTWRENRMRGVSR